MSNTTFSATLALLIGAATAARAQQNGTRIHVAPPVMVSAAHRDLQHDEMLAAIDPANPKRMLACTTALDATRNRYVNIVYMSHNGGASWSSVLDDFPDAWNGDPACAFGFGDTLYYAADYLYEGPRNTSRTMLRLSPDGGKTWRITDQRSPFEHRPFFLVDHTRSPYRGRVYIYLWGRRTDSQGTGYRTELTRLVDGKMQESAFAPGSDRGRVYAPAAGVILDDGTLVIPIGIDRDSTKGIGVTTSRDGGATLTSPVVISSAAPCKRAYQFLYQGAAVDQSDGPFHGRVYVTWDDTRSGRCAVMVASSADGGRTWSTPVMLHEDRPRTGATGPDQFQPTVAVNTNGVVGITWYDTRPGAGADTSAYALRFAASLDGGQSWLPSVRVGGAWDPAKQRWGGVGALTANVSGGTEGRPAVVSQIGPDLNVSGRHAPGDTRDMLADGTGAFLPFWYGNETGLLQLYTTAVTVDGRAAKHGDASLANLDDVTSRTTIRYSGTSFDAGTGTLSLQARLVNKSDTPVCAPVKMRVLWMGTANGTVRATNADNNAPGTGAIWDFSRAIDNGSLAAWTESRPVTLRIRLDEFDPRRAAYPWLDFETRILAAARCGGGNG